MEEIEIGVTVYWPATNSFKGLVIGIDRTPDDGFMVWIRRRDGLGDYHYHTCRLKDVRVV